MITRKDVAEKAGVSPAVVSRVLNKSGYVAEPKRKRVLKIVQELGYNPNPVAVSLKKNRTKQILYYVKDLSNNYFREMYKGMAEYASKKDYIFILAGYLKPNDLGKLMVDGILFPTEDTVQPRVLEVLTVPYVTVGYGYRLKANIKSVKIDVRSSINLAIGYLKKLGHRKIAYVTPHTKSEDDTRLIRFLDLTGLSQDSPYILGGSEKPDVLYDVNHYEFGVLGGQQFIKRKLDATAVVCFNDDIAIGLMSKLQQNGIKIPQDLSVVGIDGITEGKYSSPPLTSVSLEMNQHGRECAKTLIAMIEGKVGTAFEAIHPRLIVRDSTSAV